MPIRRDGLLEFIDLCTDVTSIWKPLTSEKSGAPIVWNFGDGTGDTFNPEHNYINLKGIKNIRVQATDGFTNISKLSFVNAWPLPAEHFEEKLFADKY